MSVVDPGNGFHDRYPLLPLKNVVVFPRNVVTLLVGRPRSMQAVDDALAADRRLIVTAHRDPEADDPRPEDLHLVGTMVAIVSSERQAAGNVQVVLEGVGRVQIGDFANHAGSSPSGPSRIEEPDAPQNEARVLIAHVQDLATRYADVRGALPAEVLDMVQRATDPGHLADLLATQLLTDIGRRQELLEIADPLRRLEQVAVHLSAELDVAALEQRIKDRVREQVEKNQREYYLREQLKAIHDELGGEGGNEIDALRRKISERGMPAEIEEKLIRGSSAGWSGCRRFPPRRPSSAPISTRCSALPWHEQSDDRLDLDEAERILERGPLRAGTGQGTHPRLPGRAQAARLDNVDGARRRPDPVPGRPSGCRQDQPRPLDRRGDGSQVRARQPRRRARRSRDSRSPPHLHRRHARPHHHRP